MANSNDRVVMIICSKIRIECQRATHMFSDSMPPPNVIPPLRITLQLTAGPEVELGLRNVVTLEQITSGRSKERERDCALMAMGL